MNLWYLMKYILYFRFMTKKTKKKTKKWTKTKIYECTEEFPTNESLLEYIREDKVMKIVTPRTQE